MATKVSIETSCDVCNSKTVSYEQEYGSVVIKLSNVPLTKEQAATVTEAEATEDGKFFGTFGREAEVCSVHCARRLLIALARSLPSTPIPNPRIDEDNVYKRDDNG